MERFKFHFLINLRVKCDCEESILGLAASKVWLPLPPPAAPAAAAAAAAAAALVAPA